LPPGSSARPCQRVVSARAPRLPDEGTKLRQLLLLTFDTLERPLKLALLLLELVEEHRDHLLRGARFVHERVDLLGAAEEPDPVAGPDGRVRRRIQEHAVRADDRDHGDAEALADSSVTQ
jgi:hypothetical protein